MKEIVIISDVCLKIYKSVKELRASLQDSSLARVGRVLPSGVDTGVGPVIFHEFKFKRRHIHTKTRTRTHARTHRVAQRKRKTLARFSTH